MANPTYRVEINKVDNPKNPYPTIRLLRAGKVIGRKKKWDAVFDYPLMSMYEWWWFDKTLNLNVRVLLRTDVDGKNPKVLVCVGEEKVRDDDDRLRQVGVNAVFV